MRVLLADDDRLFQILLEKTLAEWGYETVVVADGAQAWQQLNSPAGPRLAILDCVMPKADGLEVCQRVRNANLPHYVYIILLTAKSKFADLAAGLEAGADDYLAKPVNLSELRLRLRAGCRVLESEERQRMVADTASDGIVTVGAGGAIEYANRAAGEIFGYAPAELAGRAFSTLVPGYNHHLERREPEVSPGSREPHRSWRPVEITGWHRSGVDMILEISFSESSHVLPQRAVTAVIRDVTDRRSLERKRAQAKKLESIGQLASGVAHEINTPIQYASDNLRFIEQCCAAWERVLDVGRRLYEASKQGQPGADALAELGKIFETTNLDYIRRETPCAVQDALEGVQRVAEIVRALNEFSHPGTVEMAPADLNRIIDATALVSRNKWKDVADLYRNLDPDLPLVTCVAGELSQVFLNLIVNAADAIGEARSAAAKKGTIWITSARDGDFVEVRVRDTGTGIPEAVRSKMFDLFFTTKDVGQGSGQGLAIAYAIVVTKHRGTIDFETAMGQGTTFIVRLPIAGCEQMDAALETGRMPELERPGREADPVLAGGAKERRAQ